MSHQSQILAYLRQGKTLSQAKVFKDEYKILKRGQI